MSKKLSFSIILNATSKGLVGGFNKSVRSIKAFNKIANKGVRIMGNLEGAVVGVAGAFVGFQALTQAKQIMQDGEVAGYNLTASLRAANREFSNVGSMKSWEGAVERVSDKLRLFSNTEIRNATARTIDMTKRLGLSAEQMENLLVMSGDLGAGKANLEGSIERVTAALRGEAEASEYLGLTLNETYVKSWYNAKGAMQGAWKDLDDMQKAQVRYNVLLEQAIPLQGRAAGMAKTFFGAMSLVRKSIHDSINDNKAANEAMTELADILRENSGAIGELVASMVTGVAHVIKFTVVNKDLLVTLAKVVGSIYLLVKSAQTIGVIINIIKGVNAAIFVLSGTTLPRLIVQTQIASTHMGILTTATASFGTLLATVTGLIGAFFAGWMFGKWLNGFESVRVVAQLTFASLIGGFQMARVEYYKLIQAGREFLGLDTTAIDRKVAAAQREVEINKMVMADLIKNGDKRQEITATTVTGQKKITDAVQETGKAQKESLAGQKAAADSALTEMEKRYKKYADSQKSDQKEALQAIEQQWQSHVDKVKQLQAEISGREQSLEEEQRAMKRGGLRPGESWTDLKNEAFQYQQAAEAALKAGNFNEATDMADKARAKFKELNHEVVSGDKTLLSKEKALELSMKWTKRAGDTALQSLAGQKKASEEAAESLKKQQDALAKLKVPETLVDAMNKAKFLMSDLNGLIVESGGDWQKVWDKMAGQAGRAIGEAEERMANLTRDRQITVYVKEVVKKAIGGAITAVRKLASGGKLSGYGGGDRISALLEAGEFVVRKEAVAKYGTGFFAALNGMKLDAGHTIRARIGGYIQQRLQQIPLMLSAGGSVADTMSPSDRALAKVNGRYDKFAEQRENRGRVAKIVELRWPTGSLQGSESSVDDFLKQLELAGLRA